jgi:hypothetical protein
VPPEHQATRAFAFVSMSPLDVLMLSVETSANNPPPIKSRHLLFFEHQSNPALGYDHYIAPLWLIAAATSVLPAFATVKAVRRHSRAREDDFEPVIGDRACA